MVNHKAMRTFLASALAFYSLLCINAGEHIYCWVLKPEVHHIFRLETMFSMALLHDV